MNTLKRGFSGGACGKEPAWQCRRQAGVGSRCWEHPLEKGMATHSSILAWRIPWKEEAGGIPSIGSQRVRHDWSNLAGMHARTHLKKREGSKMFEEFSLLQAGYQWPQDSDLGWLLARRKLWKIVKDRTGPWDCTESDNWTTATGGEIVVLTRESMCFKFQ